LGRRIRIGPCLAESGLSGHRPARDLTHIQALIEQGGHIMVGAIHPIKNAAVAYDGTKAVAMLKGKAKESLPDLLARLDAAIATAKRTGQRVDEVNEPT